jgi:hypothetical protein
VSVNTHKEFALEILMTMVPIHDEGVPSSHSVWRELNKSFPMYIRELLGFQKVAPEQVDVHEGTWKVFLECDHRKRPSTKKYYLEPHHPCVSLMDVQKDFGRMRETKVTDTELSWLYSALIARQPIDPSHLILNWWCCESTSDSGDIGSGCYLSMLAKSLKPGITRNPKYLLPGTSLGFEYVKKGKYISEDERGGLQSGQSKLTPSGRKIKTFFEGREDWLEEGLLVLVKKNKRGRVVGEGFFMAQEGGAEQNYVPPFGGTPAPPSYYGDVPMQAWGSGAAMPPPNFAVLNVAFAEPYARLH